ncbi:putative alpha-fucosidase A [Aspergillus alliaceus]|uniref:Putative alpha-fucosidase A n=1 Tax=Petromyces alliaceus TaxID=209559 RepID=A0A5N7BW50_PETAA|nr:putative alpha-fucosidase A [Aspergillus alliaceus]
MSSLATAVSLWSSNSASWDTTNEAFALRNGKLGVISFGEPGAEKLNLNHDELWEGGPFEIDGYWGRNPNFNMTKILSEIRNDIWKKGIGICIYNLNLTVALSDVTIHFDQLVEQTSLWKATCDSTFARLRGITQTGPPRGMTYNTIARSSISGTCDSSTRRLTISSSSSSTLTIVIGEGTDFDATKGTEAASYTFKGEDPAEHVETITSAAISQPESRLRTGHIEDYSRLTGAFTLDLPDTQGSDGTELSKLITDCNANKTEGDPYPEKLLFDYGRHLFMSRTNGLPPILQGVWSPTKTAAWSGDYHANISLQMNLWGAEATGLGELTIPVFDYMEQNWMPRGAETAELLYGSQGWVTHNEMNIFGHTGSLVVNPCTSPEQGPVTFGCTHWQQLIHQVYENAIQGAGIGGETGSPLLKNIKTQLPRLDKGLHIGTWGEIKEWKLPDSYGYDKEGNEHRHLSHLVGWYPGWSLSSYFDGYTNATIQSAVNKFLTHLGVGITDSNAGWEKVWRSACWARLNHTERAHYELRLTIDQNTGQSGLSLYSGGDAPSGAFQMDANFGYLGTVLMPRSGDGVRTVILAPAIPAAWTEGSVKGLRLRGGGSVDFSWDHDGLVDKVSATGVPGR